MSQIQKMEPPPATTLAQFLEIRRAHIAEVLPKSKGLTAEKLIKLAVLATNKQPALKNCDMSSIFLALLQCAELGLEPSGTLGSAYLVPYGKTCQLIIGYRGLIDLARRSGALRQIEAHIVHERDSFKLRFGLEPLLEHEPFLDGDAGAPRLAYCVAQLADGAKHVEVMTLDEVRRIEGRSKAGGPWKTDWEEMAKKTVARRTCKWLPMSADLSKALAVEDETEHGRGPEAADVFGTAEQSTPALSPQNQTSKTKEAIRSRMKIIDVKPGETAEQAEQRVLSPEPPAPQSDAPSTPQFARNHDER